MKTPDMEFDYIDLDIHEDLYDIIKNTCGQSGISKEQLNEIMGIWSTVIESMLGVSHVLKAAKSDCNNSSQKVGYDDPAPSEVSTVLPFLLVNAAIFWWKRKL